MKEFFNPPKVSIIVPVRNEERYIQETLQHLIKQTYPKNNFEILVIEGMSTDGTREIVKKFEAEVRRLKAKENESQTSSFKLLPIIRLIDNPKGQRAAALNIGIREAKGDVIMRIDARTIIPPDYIEKCVKTLIETGADNVGGMQKPIVGSGLAIQSLKLDFQERISNIKHRILTQLAISIALSHPFGVGNAQFRLGKKSGYVDTVYLGCFRREIFDKVGLFDEESAVISEDADINYRIRKAGGRVYLNKDIVAYYYPRDNFRDLGKLYFRYGGAKAGNLIKRRRLTAWRQFVPPTFLLGLFLLLILGIFHKTFFYLWLLIAVIYIITDFLISLILSFKQCNFNADNGNLNSGLPFSNPKLLALDMKHRTSNIENSKLRLFWRLMLAFPIIHFSWAIGFWRRLLQRPKPGEYWGY